MCIFRFLYQNSIFSIYLCKIFNICINPQYLCKFSISIVHLRFVLLSLVCVQADLSSFRSQREGLLFRFCPICVKIFNFTYLFTFGLFSLCSVYKQIYLASGVRERENSYLFAFSYFCTLFKSFVNW